MSVFDAGLPNRTGGAASSVIGDTRLFQYTQNVVKLGDNSEWLASGVFAAASLYPAAAKLEHLRAHALSTVSAGATASDVKKRLATDGNGVYILADNDATNVRRSTDYGATWSNVAHNLGTNVTDVIYIGGGVFVLCGATVGNLVSTRSTDSGATFGGLHTVLAAGSSQNGIAMLAWSGGLVWIAGGTADNANFAASSAAGVSGTWTNRSANGAIGANIALWAGNGRAYLTGATTAISVAADGGTFAAGGTLPFSAVANVRGGVAPNGNVVVSNGSTVAAYSTDGGVTWSAQMTLPSQVRFLPNSFFTVNSRLLAVGAAGGGSVGIGLVSTLDGINWVSQSTTPDSSEYNTGTSSNIGAAGDSRTIVIAPPSVSTIRRASSTWDVSNYVGKWNAAYSAGTAATGGTPNLYYRVK
jgi:hypothetical protein